MTTTPAPVMHLPSAGRRTPVTTYRLQLGPDLTFAQAQDQLDYLQALGATDIYLSPILQAAPGSTHGYDVTDHTTISEAMGGRQAFESLAQDAHVRGMGVVVDVVPNHMAVPPPSSTTRRSGRFSRTAPIRPTRGGSTAPTPPTAS